MILFFNISISYRIRYLYLSLTLKKKRYLISIESICKIFNQNYFKKSWHIFKLYEILYILLETLAKIQCLKKTGSISLLVMLNVMTL